MAGSTSDRPLPGPPPPCCTLQQGRGRATNPTLAQGTLNPGAKGSACSIQCLRYTIHPKTHCQTARGRGKWHREASLLAASTAVDSHRREIANAAAHPDLCLSVFSWQCVCRSGGVSNRARRKQEAQRKSDRRQDRAGSGGGNTCILCQRV